MSKNQRILIVAGAGLSALAGIFIWYVWSKSISPEQVSEKGGALPKAAFRSLVPTQPFRYQSFQSPFQTGSGGAFGNAPPIGSSSPLPFEAPPRLFVPSPEPKVEPKKYTASEVFKLQYPDYYLDYLSSLQNEMVESGYLKPESVQTFRTHNDVYLFVRDYINFLADSGGLVFRSLEERNKYIDRVLANIILLNLTEASFLERGLIAPR